MTQAIERCQGAAWPGSTSAEQCSMVRGHPGPCWGDAGLEEHWLWHAEQVALAAQGSKADPRAGKGEGVGGEDRGGD